MTVCLSESSLQALRCSGQLAKLLLSIYRVWLNMVQNVTARLSEVVTGTTSPTVDNRPFYSCVLSYLAMNASEAGGDFALTQTFKLFLM